DVWRVGNARGVPQVGSVGWERPSLRIGGGESEPLEQLRGEIDPPARNAFEHGSHGRTFPRGECGRGIPSSTCGKSGNICIGRLYLVYILSMLGLNRHS